MFTLFSLNLSKCGEPPCEGGSLYRGFSLIYPE